MSLFVNAIFIYKIPKLKNDEIIEFFRHLSISLQIKFRFIMCSVEKKKKEVIIKKFKTKISLLYHEI
jgi:hypothetical protein